MQQSQSASAGNVDSLNWVVGLFPPTFQMLLNNTKVNVDDIVAPDCVIKANTDALTQFTTENEIQLDVATVKNVYHRVWLMMNAIYASDNADHSSDNTSRHTREVSVQTEDVFGEIDQPEDISCIWDSTDINVIRNVHRVTNNDNSALRGRLTILQEELVKFMQENRNMKKLTQSLNSKLSKSVASDRRLTLLVEHLRNELDKASDTIYKLHQQQESIDKFRSHIQRLEAELIDRKRMEKQETAKLKAKWLMVAEEQRIGNAAVQAELKNEAARLVEKINALSDELRDERMDHARTRTALNHLRIHFASFSGKDRPNVMTISGSSDTTVVPFAKVIVPR